MTHHFRNAALLAMAAMASLVVSGCGSTATRAPTTGTPTTGASAASSPTSPGSAPATTPAPATPGAPTRITGPAGGKITGADESVRVTVHNLSAQGPVGAYCCRAAGGTSSPWSASVTFHATSGEVITIAASTGGHVAAVERFAVTGAHAS